MTRKDIEWDKLEETIKTSEMLQSKKEEVDQKNKRIAELEKEIAQLKETKIDANTFSNAFDNFGILNVISVRLFRTDDYNYDRGEAHIEKITEDKITVSYYPGYSDWKKTAEIPLSELKEKGFYYLKSENIIVADKIHNYESFKEVLDIVLSLRKAQVKSTIKMYKEQIAEYTKKSEEYEELLKNFDNYPNDKLTKIINNIDWSLGISNAERKEYEDQLPRVYKI